MTLRLHRVDDRLAVYAGDCRDMLALLPDASVDAVVTDPPYELGFMGKRWDGTGIAYDPAVWAEAFRVLKPGGHLLSFGGTRTAHRIGCAIEDAGFEIRDGIAWLYGQGFPKSLDVSKAIDKAAGVEREITREATRPIVTTDTTLFDQRGSQERERRDIPATPDAVRWQGWGTALKPAFEPVVVARKPLVGTVAANVLAHGVGALNVDAARIGDSGGTKGSDYAKTGLFGVGGKCEIEDIGKGRWPANVALDEDVAADLGEPPSRFFYVAKAPKKERVKVDDVAHPTVKPLTLMRWLVRLVTPPGGTVVEPFAGSGTTVEAALLEGFRVIASEMTPEYLPLVDARIDRAYVELGIDTEGVA